MKKYIPNTITCCNLISGAIATGLAFEGSYKCAMLMIILGAVFDFFDGMSAHVLINDILKAYNNNINVIDKFITMDYNCLHKFCLTLT